MEVELVFFIIIYIDLFMECVFSFFVIFGLVWLVVLIFKWGIFLMGISKVFIELEVLFIFFIYWFF